MDPHLSPQALDICRPHRASGWTRSHPASRVPRPCRRSPTRTLRNAAVGFEVDLDPTDATRRMDEILTLRGAGPPACAVTSFAVPTAGRGSGVSRTRRVPRFGIEVQRGARWDIRDLFTEQLLGIGDPDVVDVKTKPAVSGNRRRCPDHSGSGALLARRKPPTGVGRKRNFRCLQFRPGTIPLAGCRCHPPKPEPCDLSEPAYPNGWRNQLELCVTRNRRVRSESVLGLGMRQVKGCRTLSPRIDHFIARRGGHDSFRQPLSAPRDSWLIRLFFH